MECLPEGIGCTEIDIEKTIVIGVIEPGDLIPSQHKHLALGIDGDRHGLEDPKRGAAPCGGLLSDVLDSPDIAVERSDKRIAVWQERDIGGADLALPWVVIRECKCAGNDGSGHLSRSSASGLGRIGENRLGRWQFPDFPKWFRALDGRCRTQDADGALLAPSRKDQRRAPIIAGFQKETGSPFDLKIRHRTLCENDMRLLSVHRGRSVRSIQVDGDRIGARKDDNHPLDEIRCQRAAHLPDNSIPGPVADDNPVTRKDKSEIATRPRWQRPDLAPASNKLSLPDVLGGQSPDPNTRELWR